MLARRLNKPIDPQNPAIGARSMWQITYGFTQTSYPDMEWPSTSGARDRSLPGLHGALRRHFDRLGIHAGSGPRLKPPQAL